MFKLDKSNRTAFLIHIRDLADVLDTERELTNIEFKILYY
ncbi:hypothetical protein [Acinetobacter sp. SAAs470]